MNLNTSLESVLRFIAIHAYIEMNLGKAFSRESDFTKWYVYK